MVSPTPLSSSGSGLLNFTIFHHAIGGSGDNANPASSFSNKNPLHSTQSASISFYNSANLMVASLSSTITYSSPSGNFIGTADLSSIPAGNYTIKIKTNYHLARNIPGFPPVVPGQSLTLSPIHLVTGDANNDNALNILDYNIIVGCYSDLSPASDCNDTNKLASDLNDDGLVNAIDYNLFLREITFQAGD
jgi:hypothetical protein